MRFVKPSSGAGLLPKSLLEHLIIGEIRREHLEGYIPIAYRVVGSPHHAHAALAQRLDKAITPERRALHRLTIRTEPVCCQEENRQIADLYERSNGPHGSSAGLVRALGVVVDLKRELMVANTDVVAVLQRGGRTDPLMLYVHPIR